MKIDELVSEITRNAQLYYEGNTEISDDEFDKLVEELRKEDPENKILHTTGWGYNPSGKKVNHKYGNMGSIERKPRKIEDIPENLIYCDLIRISAKLDGISASAEFKNGKLIRGLTRGNGITGVDRTDKISRILQKCMKQDLPKDFTGAIRGELVISNDSWNVMVEQGIAGDKSSRNLVAGIINRNKTTDDIDFVDFVPYKIIACEGSIGNSLADITEMTNFLERYFNSIVQHCYCKKQACNEALTQEYLEDMFKQFRESYPCDGCVITGKITQRDNIFDYDEIAYKFDSETAISRVDHIDWNLTRTGLLIPTVCIDPVNLGGATISRATGFNAAFICENKIGPNARIEIRRSGEVIPDIVKVIEPTDVEDLVPSKCPVCGEDSIIWIDPDNGSPHVGCANPECSGRDYRNLQQWVACIGNVDGIGDTLKFKFFDELEISNISELYSKDIQWDTRGYKQRELFSKVLDKLFREPIEVKDALQALNIPRLGGSSADKLSIVWNELKSVLDSNNPEAEFDNISKKIEELVGKATTESIRSNFDKFKNLNLIKERIISSSEPESSSMEYIKVCITGKLSVKRSDFEKYLLDHGYKNASISKDTKYLITDNPNSNSSKNKKASELGITKITEAEFRNIVEG